MSEQGTGIRPDAGPVVENPWRALRRFTTARIGLGRAGTSLPTQHHLAFQLDHARARDAVHSALDVTRLLDDLAPLGRPTLLLHSAAPDRATYLRRPDLGRRLDPESARLIGERESGQPGNYDAALIVADGLSALAVQRHAAPLLAVVLPRLETAGWRIAPLAVVEQGRVAISDEIGALLGADLAVILIGERPGLSSPDSLGIYLTWGPKIGNTDAGRNCISNIRDAGLSYDEAATRLLYLMTEARRRRLSGVNLKDASTPAAALGQGPAGKAGNFLVEGDGPDGG